jgi:hypothetical protein
MVDNCYGSLVDFVVDTSGGFIKAASIAENCILRGT